MLLDKIKVEKVVHPKIRQMIETGAKDNPYFCFFPVWGSGGMLLDLINRTGDNELIEEAEPYLDIELRLRKTFSKLDKGALEKHLQSLRSQRRNTLVPLPFNPADHTICNAAGNGFPVRIRLIYADILAMPLMRDDEFRGVRRAVTSSEDTCISAGAGVAFSLAKEAGDYFLLHELAKFTDVPQRSIAVTSAGNLPAHFIFHAAALKIQNDGQYAVTADDVMETTSNAIRMAHALEVGALWVPLMGAGTGGLDENQSLTAILKAAVLPEVQAGKQLDLIVVIYKESKFSRDAVLVTAEQILGAAYTVTRFKP
jgi:O-acetyl-ADP-ribose deacetylase (regulator of RNase III)